MRTKPHTIRFDEKLLPAALKKSGLTVQKLIDKLISDYIADSPVKEITSFKLDEVSLMSDGSYGAGISKVVFSEGGRRAGKTHEMQTWVESQKKATTKTVKAKELKPEVIGKPYNPMDNPIFRSKNKLK